MTHDSRARTLAKMFSYRVAVAALLAAITFFLTGNTGLTAVVTVVFNVSGSIVYYVCGILSPGGQRT